MTTPPEKRIAELAPGAAALASAQVAAALEMLADHDLASLIFPWPDVHRVVHPVRPGRVVLIAAATGQGKSTFSFNFVRRLLNQCVPQPHVIDLICTETLTKEAWIHLACLDAGVPAGVAINADWEAWGDREAKQRVRDEMLALLHAYGACGRLRIVPHESITVRRVEEAAASAARRGATLLVIDHLDRIEVGDKDEFQGTRFLARRLTDLAQMHNLVIVAFSQLNLQAHAGNRLAVYAPPRLVAMRGGGSKAEEAAVVLGIYRPKRGRMLGETADEWTNVLRAVKAGDRPVTDAISRDMMGIVVMKHRYGIEGAPAFLRYDKGRLTEWAPTLAPRPGVV